MIRFVDGIRPLLRGRSRGEEGLHRRRPSHSTKQKTCGGKTCSNTKQKRGKVIRGQIRARPLGLGRLPTQAKRQGRSRRAIRLHGRPKMPANTPLPSRLRARTARQGRSHRAIRLEVRPKMRPNKPMPGHLRVPTGRPACSHRAIRLELRPKMRPNKPMPGRLRVPTEHREEGRRAIRLPPRPRMETNRSWPRWLGSQVRAGLLSPRSIQFRPKRRYPNLSVSPSIASTRSRINSARPSMETNCES